MNVSPQPQISVLMAAHNEEAYIDGAINSLLGQTFADFELIVVDDASSDGTGARLQAVGDPRVRILRNETCLGLTRSLIVGMAAARAPFIARLDADDLAMPQRLELQLHALLNHPSLGLVGSDCHGIDGNGALIGTLRMPRTDLAIRWRCLLDNPFVHSSIMFRYAVYQQAGGYDPAITVAQDYDLWTRMLRFTQASNLAARLVAYRVRQGSVTDQHRQKQLQIHDRIAYLTLREVMPATGLSPERYRQLRALYAGGPPAIPPAEIAPLVMDFWSLFKSFYANHAPAPGSLYLMAYEWLRCARHLLHAPLCKTTLQAWQAICSPRFNRTRT